MDVIINACPKLGVVIIWTTAGVLSRAHVGTQFSWWRHQMETFSALLALCVGNSPVPVNSPHKGQWRGALMFSLISARINNWVNNREAGDLRRHRGHYEVSVMSVRFESKYIIFVEETEVCLSLNMLFYYQPHIYTLWRLFRVINTQPFNYNCGGRGSDLQVSRIRTAFAYSITKHWRWA